MTSHRMLLVSGWAHPASCLRPLADAVKARLDVRLIEPEPDALRAALAREESPVWLAGWSLGGILALQAAAEQPARIRGLLMVSSTARFTRFADDDPTGVPAGELRALAALLRSNPETALERFRRRCAAPHEPLGTPGTTSPAPNVSALRVGLKLLGELDLRAACASLRMPALILHGHADAVIPPAAAERLARDIPGARARRHSTAGHDLPLREPAWVGREILSFLDVSP